VTLVSESYVILYCEKNVIRNSPLNEIKYDIIFGSISKERGIDYM
jgi:hypothetical protein